jgi:hypothetical protein
MKYFAAVFFLVLAIRLLSAEPDPAALLPATLPVNATATVPYAELKSLWAAAHPTIEKPKPPPVDGALLSASYDAAWETDSLAIKAHFVAESFLDGWCSIPILGEGVRIRSVSTPDVRMASSANGVALLIKGQQRIELDLVFEVAIEEWERGASATINLAPAPIATMHVAAAPGGELCRLETTSNTPQLLADGGTVPIGGANVITLSRAAPDTIEKQTWDSTAELLVEPGESRLACTARLVAESLSGDSLAMDLALPATARVADVSGDDLAEWRVEPPRENSRRLHVRWKTARVPMREVSISYDLPAGKVTKIQPPLSETTEKPWLLIVPRVEGAETVIAEGTVSDRGVPGWVSERVKGRQSAVREITGSASLKLTKLPRVESRDVIISRAEYSQRVVVDGATRATASYYLTSGDGGELTLELPEQATLLLCSVEGNRIAPIKSDKAFAIPVPPGLMPGKTGNVIVSYTLKGVPMDPVSGKLELTLPKSPQFFETIDWILELPSAYEVSSLEGNAHFVSATRAENGSVVRLRKELCNGETPQVQVYYARPETNP